MYPRPRFTSFHRMREKSDVGLSCTGSPYHYQFWSYPLYCWRRPTGHAGRTILLRELTAFIAAQLKQAEVICGGAANLQQTYLAGVDPAVMKQIQDELTGHESGGY